MFHAIRALLRLCPHLLLLQHFRRLFHRHRIGSICQRHLLRLTDAGEGRRLNSVSIQIRHGKYFLRRVKRNLFSLMQKQNAVTVGGQLLNLLLNH